ncbi:hypothetical protein A3H03_01110 [Candidatus Kuenenbacteria bacterium RIFCSPLOWO2_12_FULL_42_13]|uniref:Uncharacterized protein n=3 Tax=Candidatus Kueneniibacteriota TaxID=1752740 RepID=A0A1F6G285_9BACT|nr:MAG: hypothetical protein A3C68_01005 [Candidatus Kuenenbacteria bacterium RIFCSPHIGHO2_02_FULL_42_29]OGG91020.1 MAG: hypothetical protein A3H55_01020 [Candidatus Kuenenbacteria bacterium RIFCSPLOWO2_02_FULL_42_16]OGG92203.1 MAG: hypothetical protein A3H03_01110 [Candidatus Kuenenbacteria bacterium RIFCSPLOWO2_12_FULL_42_13]OGG98538.1 MAG: hypothetical protein A3E04_01210 [Candidatus Kuenenbacteria bacterium RIFCSPHIGHO2_12_FULL_42_14]
MLLVGLVVPTTKNPDEVALPVKVDLPVTVKVLARLTAPPTVKAAAFLFKSPPVITRSPVVVALPPNNKSPAAMLLAGLVVPTTKNPDEVALPVTAKVELKVLAPVTPKVPPTEVLLPTVVTA